MRTESRRFTLFLASIAALTSLSIDMSLPTVPAIERQFGQLAGQGGLIMSLFLAGYAFTPLIGGPLADRLGRRPVLLLSLILFGFSALACSLSTSFAMLLIFRLVQGCASGVSTTLPLAIVRDLMEGSAARKRISEVTTINSIMPLIAPIAGSCVMLLGTWRLLFATQAIFALGIVFVLQSDFSETLDPSHRRRLQPRAMLGNYLHLLTNRNFLGFALINALTFACIFSFISVSPLILIQRMGVKHYEYPVMFAAIGAGTILGAFVSALLNQRNVAAGSTIVSGLALMNLASISALSLQAFGFHRPMAILAPVFVTLFGFGLLSPSVTVEALASVPDMAGSGSGALRSILMIFGSGVSGYLATFCARHLVHAETITTLVMSGSAMLALTLYLTLLRNRAV